MINKLREQSLGITRRVLRRDFSGNTGQAIKNSIYSFSTNVVAKVGSLLFTIVLAKKLLPIELFGLYSLALSTILLFAGFTDLGIGTSLTRYVSKYGTKSGGYIRYLGKIKLILTVSMAVILMICSSFLSNYYNKPIFLAVIAGGLYIVSTSLLSFFSGLFQAENNFKTLFFRELLFQTLRLILVPLAVVLTIVYSTSIVLMWIILALSICYLIVNLIFRVNLKKYDKSELERTKKKEVNRFVIPLTMTALSGAFFGYVDMVMLGKFVDAQFIAYYQAASSLLYSGTALISFGASLFPIFSRLKGNKLERGLRKSRIMSIVLSTIGLVGTIIVAPFLINLVYTVEYSPAILILQVLAIIFLVEPLIGLYSSYYISEGKNYFVAKVLIFATVLNIALNYILITSLLTFGEYPAVFGAVIATIISKSVYLGLFIFGRMKINRMS